MLGAIIGDVAGSIYEWQNIKTANFELITENSHFTDDTVLTIAVAESILLKTDYAKSLKKWGLKYPNAGYGGSFLRWLHSDNAEPYNSWGNGSAMRVSAVGWAFDSIEQTLTEAKNSAEVTHNHPEGIKGAKAVASAVFLARNGKTKEEIKQYIETNFKYDLNRSIDSIRPIYEYDVSCQGSVPEAIIAFLESVDFESAIKLAISLGGDSDTIGCIAGAIAQAFYKKIPEEIAMKVIKKLPADMLKILNKFENEYVSCQ